MTRKERTIDFKSFIIGFLLAAVVFLVLGAGSGTQDIRIVGVSTSDSLSVKITDIGSFVEIPVKIEDQPLEVKTN